MIKLMMKWKYMTTKTMFLKIWMNFIKTWNFEMIKNMQFIFVLELKIVISLQIIFNYMAVGQLRKEF